MKQSPQSPNSDRLSKSANWSRALLAFSSIAISTGAFAAPIPILSAPGAYSQDFSTLNTSGSPVFTDDSTIVGVYSQRSGTGNTIVAGAGTSGTGALYSFGTGTATERALGTVGSGTPGDMAHGVQFQNTSGSAVTINTLGYVGEQWRKSGTTTPETVTLWYRTSSVPITALDPSSDTNWIALPSGDFTSPVNTATTSALDGNAAANRTPISFDPSLNLASGQYVMFRWKDINHPGANGDHGLAIDDVSVAWVANAAPPITVSASPNSFAENAGSAASEGTVSVAAAVVGTDLVIDLSSSDTTEAMVPSTATIPVGQTSANFTITAVNDLIADGAQAVTLSASATGYVTGQTSVTVTDDTDAVIAVTVESASFGENAGPTAAVGTVTLAENTPVDVVVDLVSSDLTEATVPLSVTILQNTKTISFDVAAVNDLLVDGTRNVTITATAFDYSQGSAIIQVTDDGDMPPPATLSQGAIAFTGYNSDVNDALAFVVLSPIAATDVILFTDNEWNGLTVGSGGVFNTGEGVLTWTPGVAVAAGTVVNLLNLTSPTPAASIGTIVESGSFDLTNDGDTVYAYQGDPQVATGFLAVISANTDLTDGTSLTTSQIVRFTGDPDIAAYKGTRICQASFAGFLALIDDTATNWDTQDGTGDQSGDGIVPDVPFKTTAFMIFTDGSPYGIWASTNAGCQTADLDFDGDGLDNGTEYFMGTAANAFTPNPGIVAGAVTFPRAAGTTITSFKVEVSTNLTNWEDAAVNYLPNLSITAGQVVFTMPTAPEEFFIRLSVTP